MYTTTTTARATSESKKEKNNNNKNEIHKKTHRRCYCCCGLLDDEVVEQGFASLLHNAHLRLDVELVVEVDVLETVAEVLHLALQFGLYVLEEHFGLLVLQVVGVRIGELERVAGARERVQRLGEELPVDEGAALLVHDLLVDALLALGLELLLDLEAVGMIRPAVVVVRVAVERLARIVLLRVALVAIAIVRCAVDFPVVKTH